MTSTRCYEVDAEWMTYGAFERANLDGRWSAWRIGPFVLALRLVV